MRGWCVCVCACSCAAAVGVVSGSIWVSWKLCGVRKTTSHKSGGRPMFYKDRTLLRMSLRKTLGSGPHVGCKCSASLFPLILSRLIFHLVRDKKEEGGIDGMECGRQRLRRGEKPALIAIPSVCIETEGEQWQAWGWGVDLVLTGSGINRKEAREGWVRGREGWRAEEPRKLKAPAKVKGK